MKFCHSEVDATENMICPRTIGVGPVYHPTDGQGIMDGGPWHCVGSKCMAWRWTDTHVIKDGELIASGDTDGFCGLAGIPAER